MRDSKVLCEGNASSRCQANDWMPCKSEFTNDASVEGWLHVINSVLNWRSCSCRNRGIESKHGVRLSPIAFTSASHKTSFCSGTSPIWKSITKAQCPRFKHGHGNIAQSPTVSKSEIINKPMKKNSAVRLEVTSSGTELMKIIEMPTVIAKFLNGDLQRSKVYYATLQMDTAWYEGEIPAVLFSSRYHCRRTKYCELLPLVIGRSKQISGRFELKPMPKSKHWKRIFSKGCSFKVTVLKSGRVVNKLGEYPWNVYDVRTRELRNLLKSIVSRDIRQMPAEIIETLVASRKAMHKYKCYSEKEKTESGALPFGKLSEIF